MKFVTLIKFFILLIAFSSLIFAGYQEYVSYGLSHEEKRERSAKDQATYAENRGRGLFRGLRPFAHPLANNPQFGAALDITFKTLDEKNVSLDDFRGKYVLLNIWATWCTPCVKELPSLQNLKNTIEPEGWVVLSVANEYKVDTGKIGAFTEKLGVEALANYYFDPVTSRIGKLLVSSPGLPTTFLINPEGYFFLEITGDAVWDSPAIMDFLKGFPK
jgi:thiol-disulfide isomerase/thioredoxin